MSRTRARCTKSTSLSRSCRNKKAESRRQKAETQKFLSAFCLLPSAFHALHPPASSLGKHCSHSTAHLSAAIQQADWPGRVGTRDAGNRSHYASRQRRTQRPVARSVQAERIF